MHLRSGEIRAAKIIYKENLTFDQTQEFLRRVKILQGLDHPNVVKVFEIFEDARSFQLVMEICEGDDFINTLADDYSESKVIDLVK